MATKKATRKNKFAGFDPVIYPRTLWVSVGFNVRDLEATLCRRDGSPIDGNPDSDSSTIATTYPLVMERLTGNYGTLVVLSPGIEEHQLVHEAFHAGMSMLYDVGGRFFSDDQEPAAYLVGWVFKMMRSLIEEK